VTLTVLTPLRSEARAVRAALPGARVVRTGMGPARAAAAARRALGGPGQPLAIAGFCAGLLPGMAPGYLVVASEVRGPEGIVPCPSSGVLVAALRRLGLPARRAPICSVGRLVGAGDRARLPATGAAAADMESAWLARAAAGRPLAVLRVVVDAPDAELLRPGLALAGPRAWRSLRRAAPALAAWAAAAGPRRVLLAGPRSFCAGVERAIEVVERLLEREPPPVYVRKQIVHNRHVVGELERRGAVFVDDLDQVPDGATVVFSAHGVSPQVRSQAAGRRLRVVDATCPLVTKVHAEARRFAARGDTVVLIGHAGHEEVEGTTGEAPGAVRLVERPDDVDRLTVPDPDRLAYLTQTTLAADEVERVLTALRRRFPALRGPASDDICYATTNRQAAVRALAGEADLLLVVGSANSSNSRRLVEVAERAGCPAHLLDDDTGLDPAWLVGAGTVGLTAGASAPERLVGRVVDALAGLGPVTVAERAVAAESLRFTLPREVS
jgi:4-hydroxy-3-methylbut-2-enyl diphosphate reductase